MTHAPHSLSSKYNYSSKHSGKKTLLLCAMFVSSPDVYHRLRSGFGDSVIGIISHHHFDYFISLFFALKSDLFWTLLNRISRSISCVAIRLIIIMYTWAYDSVRVASSRWTWQECKIYLEITRTFVRTDKLKCTSNWERERERENEDPCPMLA